MVKRFALPLACTLVLTSAALWMPWAASSPPDGRGSWTNQDAARFWTPERMANAMPQSAPYGSEELPAPNANVSTTIAPAGAARHISGIPTVGVLFSVDESAEAHFCSASVVHSPSRSLVLTAAHCEAGTDVVFVPDYAKGAKAQPYGTWAVDQVFTDPRWGDFGTGSDYDFAFARVKRNDQGKSIEDVTGANILTRTPGWTNKVTVIGYPGEAFDPTGRAISCTTATSRLSGMRQLQMDCGGYYDGTSGSPWLLDFDPKTRTGKVIGLVGGLDGGGPDDSVSYSPLFEDALFTLYGTAGG
ncbi:trypsin-like serine peptidase [Streptomyces sp. H39-S7]|uniref:trypsin-like serine peptidase n=1 Tax=Streptomyces sp. H39-S7 TaxID=3004357 RepID=UPI0022AF40C7|nr:trypsin-like serine protease [Streptomyces sp. H39-S7]MCZ4118552.1 trypsin-like serine protease [Streptomyces sp. H39-S7]